MDSATALACCTFQKPKHAHHCQCAFAFRHGCQATPRHATPHPSIHPSSAIEHLQLPSRERWRDSDAGDGLLSQPAGCGHHDFSRQGAIHAATERNHMESISLCSPLRSDCVRCLLTQCTRTDRHKRQSASIEQESGRSFELGVMLTFGLRPQTHPPIHPNYKEYLNQLLEQSATTTIIIVVVVVVMIAAGQGQGPSASDEHSAPSLSLCDRSCGQRRDEDCHRQADGRSDRIQVSSLWLHSRTTSEALDACLPRSTYVYIYIYIHT